MGKVVKLRGIVFDVLDSEAIVLGLDSDTKIDVNKELEVPTLVDGKPVTEIAAGAFFQAPVSKWCLPATIWKIGHKAFVSSGVERVVFYASSVCPYRGNLKVCKDAFKMCTNLKMFSTMQNIVADENAFMGCYRLTAEELIHPMKFAKVEKNAFYGCDKLHNILVTHNATLLEDALYNSAIKTIIFDHVVHMHKNVLDFIKINDVEVVTGVQSELAYLAYEGIKVKFV